MFWNRSIQGSCVFWLLLTILASPGSTRQKRKCSTTDEHLHKKTVIFIINTLISKGKKTSNQYITVNQCIAWQLESFISCVVSKSCCEVFNCIYQLGLFSLHWQCDRTELHYSFNTVQKLHFSTELPTSLKFQWVNL